MKMRALTSIQSQSKETVIVKPSCASKCDKYKSNVPFNKRDNFPRFTMASYNTVWNQFPVTFRGYLKECVRYKGMRT